MFFLRPPLDLLEVGRRREEVEDNGAGDQQQQEEEALQSPCPLAPHARHGVHVTQEEGSGSGPSSPGGLFPRHEVWEVGPRVAAVQPVLSVLLLDIAIAVLLLLG